MDIKKYYCASPFFNRFERTVRDFMIEGLSGDIFRPDLTENSNNYDKSPSIDLAHKLLDDNIKGIQSSDALVFPRYTNDLGTLFEVGYACSLGKEIVRFDYLYGSYDVINNYKLIKLEDNSIVNLANNSDAILLGMNFGKDIGYIINSGDNIMLMDFKKYKYYDNELKEVKLVINNGIDESGEYGKKSYIPLSTINSIPPINHYDFDYILGEGQSKIRTYTGVS